MLPILFTLKFLCVKSESYHFDMNRTCFLETGRYLSKVKHFFLSQFYFHLSIYHLSLSVSPDVFSVDKRDFRYNKRGEERCGSECQAAACKTSTWYAYQFQRWLLHVWSNFLLMHLDIQQEMGQLLGPCHPHGNPMRPQPSSHLDSEWEILLCLNFAFWIRNS